MFKLFWFTLIVLFLRATKIHFFLNTTKFNGFFVPLWLEKQLIMKKTLLFYAILFLLLGSCGRQAQRSSEVEQGKEIKLAYAQNLRMRDCDGYTRVDLLNPWKKGDTLHTYYLINKEGTPPRGKGTVIRTPLQRVVVFTTAHANLLEWLGANRKMAGVADAKYMLIPDVQQRLGKTGGNQGIVDCGDAMNPNVERIVETQADAIWLSPFENSGGYGALDKTGIPIIECADYMETSALGRAEWMRFYGRLVGRDAQADSLFAVVEREYRQLSALAKKSKERKSILPERMTGSVWYLPGGQSTMGRLYRDAHIGYAFANDDHSGSLTLPFETVLDKAGRADIWLMSYNGRMNKNVLKAEFAGYQQLHAWETGQIYGCAVDRKSYFEEVSWRPDWLLRDLLVIFHPSLRPTLGNKLRYYQAI